MEKDIPLLTASDVELRIAQLQQTNQGTFAVLLAYKNSRVDMRILDECFGSMNWKREHTVIDGRLFCAVCVCDEKIPMFIMIVTEKKKVILNLESLDSTKLLLSQIESQCGKKAVKEEYVLSDEEKRKNKRNTRIAIGAFVSVIAIVAVIVIIVMSIGSVNVILTDTDMEIDATMMNKTIPYSEIDSVEIVTDLDYGYRVAGTSNSKVLTGSFENDVFGRYYLAVYKDVSESIVVHTAEKVYVVNLVDSESTVNLYNELLTHLDLS